MNEFIISFSLGMFGVLILFFSSCVMVFLAKSLILTLKKYAPKKAVQEEPPKKPAPPKREKPPKSPPVIRTIEIDPSQVDRIYVKKAQ